MQIDWQKKVFHGRSFEKGASFGSSTDRVVMMRTQTFKAPDFHATDVDCKSECDTHNQLQWAELQLSHYVIEKRSIFVVLDSWFEPPRLHQKCRQWIDKTFKNLSESDYFGLCTLDDIDEHQMQLEKVN
jgi:hypothetical protein